VAHLVATIEQYDEVSSFRVTF